MFCPIIESNGNQYWLGKDGKYHRTDGPAYIWADGSMSWYEDGKLHRTDGPAFIDINGYKEWYVNGKRKITNLSFQRAAKLSNEDMNFIILKYGNVND
jgi:hypothetical protein